MRLKYACIGALTAMMLSVSADAFATNGLAGQQRNNGIRKAHNIDADVLNKGLTAYNCAKKMGVDIPNELLTIIDYSKPSSQRRMWILDMKKGSVKSEQLVAHGSGSGAATATKFSNKNGSHQSSLGVFKTASTYTGRNGLSLRLDGLEKGVNDKARSRAIVIHGANYVNEKYAKRNGRIGRSWGCPALDPKKTKSTINDIKNGSMVFAYYPDDKWLTQSEFLNC